MCFLYLQISNQQSCNFAIITNCYRNFIVALFLLQYFFNKKNGVMTNVFLSFLILFQISSYSHEIDCVSVNELIIAPNDSIPYLNNGVIDFVNFYMGKKVGRGECWDLAAEALDKVGAKWDGVYKYGKRINPKKEKVFPGDIIQFEKVKVIYYLNGVKYTSKMAHHTAVIYSVIAKGKYTIAHQNTQISGRKVGLSDLKLKDIVKGKYYIYRHEK